MAHTLSYWLFVLLVLRFVCHDLFNLSSTKILRPRVGCNARVRDVIETALAARATYAVVHVLRVGLTRQAPRWVRACGRACARACVRDAQAPFC